MTDSDTQLFSRWAAPSWVAAYLNYGVSGYHPRVRRRLQLVNAIALYTASTSVFFATFYVTYSPSGLWPMAVALSACIVLSALTPLGNRINDIAGATIFSSVWFVGLILISFLGGNQTGLHFTFVAFAASWLLLVGYRRRWIALILALLSIAVFMVVDAYFDPPYLLAADETFAMIVRIVFIPWILMIVFGLVFYAFHIAYQAEAALEIEHQRSESVLRNALPNSIADRLKSSPNKVIADNIDEVSILFADIVDFTPRATIMPATDLVRFLDRIFTEFDHLTAAHNLTKIKTIGDAYMVAAGMPEPRADHAEAAAELALEMLAACERLSKELGEEINVRIGLHTGPAVAGVIGKQRFAYDVWGDTVNTAARMESHGKPVKIQITEATLAALGDKYEYEPRGSVEIKGKGLMATWWLRRHSSPVS